MDQNSSNSVSSRPSEQPKSTSTRGEADAGSCPPSSDNDCPDEGGSLEPFDIPAVSKPTIETPPRAEPVAKPNTPHAQVWEPVPGITPANPVFALTGPSPGLFNGLTRPTIKCERIEDGWRLVDLRPGPEVPNMEASSDSTGSSFDLAYTETDVDYVEFHVEHVEEGESRGRSRSSYWKDLGSEALLLFVSAMKRPRVNLSFRDKGPFKPPYSI
ncbi:hypothetical protein EJ06DRAFT_286678 [Trichodelitschia bisporula]|uniref:Uncharacterized protein n=1 Tax=Trichodelitschia bisporula TaxID=703511 RepID=A0A6G1I6N6_9PEZI|nr:hypothetical protein EJ06DRAFT_286678 [Trichodelitschia bisporula]